MSKVGPSAFDFGGVVAQDAQLIRLSSTSLHTIQYGLDISDRSRHRCRSISRTSAPIPDRNDGGASSTEPSNPFPHPSNFYNRVAPGLSLSEDLVVQH
jgi:hypothetical protein